MKILSLCDYTGNMVQPWVDNGHDCFIVDSLHSRGSKKKGGVTRIGADIRELHPTHRWLPEDKFDMVFAFPPCTHFAFSGQAWRRGNGPNGVADAWQVFSSCWNLCNQLSLKWMIENPRGLLNSWVKPNYVFQPWQYGDLYTKETCLWTSEKFIMPGPLNVEMPKDVTNKIHTMSPGPDRSAKRSETPMGFAAEVFKANTKNLI